MKILDRYLIKEAISPFFLGVVGFILVLTVDLLFTFVDLIINKGMPFHSIFLLLVYKLPSIMILTFPVATLFGTAMAIGRLSKDNEVAALRTSGVSFGRIAIPILIMSLFISVISFYTNEKIVPIANQKSQKIIREIVMHQPIPEIKENVFFKDPHNRYFYIQKVNTKNKTLENILVYELFGEQLPRVIIAKSAKFNNLDLVLTGGKIHKFNDSGHIVYEAVFDEMKMDLEEDIFSVADQKTTDEMNASELEAQINTLSKTGTSTNSLKTDLFLKYSIPLTSFIFALIGLPLSLPGLRGSRTWGMVLTIVIMFTFYVFASVFRSLGRGGILSPFPAAWTPQLLFGILGAILLYIEAKKR